MIQIKDSLKTIIKHKAAQNFIIIGIIAVFQLFNNVILGRQLEKEQFGQYSFVFNNIVGLLSIILLFGRNSSILRYFSSRDFMDYKWKKFIYRDSTLLIIPLFVAMFGIKMVYKLDWFWFWMGISSSYLMCCTNIVSALLRSKGFFTTTLLLERAHPIILAFILLALNIFFGSVNITSAAVAKIISYSIQIPIIFYMLIRWREGQAKIEKIIFKDSLALWELNLSVVVLSSIDAFFIAKILSFEELALFSIVYAIMQIYEFARIAIFQVYSQKFSQTHDNDIVLFNRILVVIVVIVSFFYLVSTNFLLELLFNGKYSINILQLILFCIYNAISLLYVLPSCYIIGQSSSKDLRFMLGVNLTSIAVKLGLILLLARFGFGLSGFLIAGIVSQSVRTLFGYYMVAQNKKIKWTVFFKLTK